MKNIRNFYGDMQSTEQPRRQQSPHRIDIQTISTHVINDVQMNHSHAEEFSLLVMLRHSGLFSHLCLGESCCRNWETRL